jgi:LysM repeat protein
MHLRGAKVRTVLTVAAAAALLMTLLPGVAAAHERYEVQRGDTLSSIALEHVPGGSWQAIYRDNPQLNDPDLIIAGTVLRVPVTLDDLSAPPAAPEHTAPEPETETETTEASTSTASSSSAGVWDKLAACESSGNWQINGQFDGGLQFHPDTWLAYGGGQYAQYAYQASKSEQIAIAERVLAGQGWGAWPACADKLGLR